MPRFRFPAVQAGAAAALMLALTACSTTRDGGGPAASAPPSVPAPSSSAASPSSAAASESPTSVPTSASPTAPEPTRGTVLPDSCGLLTEAEVEAVNGHGGAPVRDGGSDAGSYSIDGCHFGTVKTGLVSIQIVRPAAGPNPITSALGSAGTPVAGLPTGLGYPTGTMLGGTGPGHTVTAVSGDVLLAVSLLSSAPVTPAQKSALGAAVSASLARL